MLAELIATEGVVEIHRPGLPVGVMAIHGGLEEGTDIVAGAVAAATGATIYAVVQPETLWWHVPSTLFDPGQSPALLSFLGQVDAALSLHGYGEPGLEDTALLGGSNRALAMLVSRELAAHGISSLTDLEAIPKRLRGVHPDNPVNRPPRGGVQIELPMSLRRGSARGRVVDALVSSVHKAVVDISGPWPVG